MSAVLWAALLAGVAAAHCQQPPERLDQSLASLSRARAFLAEAGDSARGRFAKAAPADAARAEADWKQFDLLLGGGGLDEGGVWIRNELKKIPSDQWYFVIALDREWRAIHDDLGNGSWGNLKENTGLCKPGRLCYEREASLDRRMKPLMSPPFGHWTSRALTANPDKLPSILPGKHGEHHAGCFIYDDGSTRTEIVADSWDGALLPSYSWWSHWDKDAHDDIHRRAPNAMNYCSDDYVKMRADQEQRREKLKEASDRVGRLEGMSLP